MNTTYPTGKPLQDVILELDYISLNMNAKYWVILHTQQICSKYQFTNLTHIQPTTILQFVMCPLMMPRNLCVSMWLL